MEKKMEKRMTDILIAYLIGFLSGGLWMMAREWLLSVGGFQ